MENGIQAITAMAAIVLAVAGVALTLQLVLWRALAASGTTDAPEFLRHGRGVLPSVLVTVAAAGLIALLRG